MHNSINRFWPFLCGGLLVFSACVEDKSTSDNTEAVEEVIEENGTNGKMVKYDGEIFSIPSPVQTAILIRKSDAKFNADLLNDISNVDKYVTEVKKALNLGVFGADLAYLANFGHKQESINYFKEVEQLSTELDVKGAIDNSIFARFYENIDNRDSLYAINAEFYRAGDTYLKDSDRNQAAALIMTGGWIESMHLAIDVANISEDVRGRIGEQGKAINSLVGFLSPYEDEAVVEIRTALENLAAEYQGFDTDYFYVKPIHDQDNRTTYINSKSTVVVTDEQLASIKGQLSAIRSLIIE